MTSLEAAAAPSGSGSPLLESTSGESLPVAEEESLESIVEAAAAAERAAAPAPASTPAPSLAARMTSIAMVVPAKLLFGFRS